VRTVSIEVAVPPTAGVTDVGLSVHVGPNDRAGDTEQVSDTGLLNPFTPEAVTAKTAEFPVATVALTGLALNPKSGPSTTWLKGAEVWGLKLVSPL